MLIRLYRVLLLLYPVCYRSTFGREMATVFHQRQTDAWNRGAIFFIAFCIREFTGLITAAFRERARAARLWVSRPECAEQPAATGAAGQAFDGVPAFYTCETYSPRRSALINGGVLSLALFSAVTAAFEYGVNRNTFRQPPGHSQAESRPEYFESSESGFAAFGRSLVKSTDGVTVMILGKQPAMAAIDLVKPKGWRWEGVWSNLLWVLRVRPRLIPGALPVTRSEGGEPADPWRNDTTAYFRVILVLQALDADHDEVISAAEIANAPAALRTLDANHDGRLTADECGQSFTNNPGENVEIEAKLDPEYVKRMHLAFMRFHPVLAALDADHDGVISASEIQNAPAALQALDKNGDGKLTRDELLPDALAK